MNSVLSMRRVESGLRPFNPYRDLETVIDLIALAFGERLGPSGQATLLRMRRFARRSRFLWWLQPLLGGVAVAPGFVWVEGGRVVGNVSFRRGVRRGSYFIGNVVVHPDWRGRGIATTLVRSALDRISAHSGRWVGLEVRVDNEAARRLYDGLGFREVGRTVHMLRPADLSWPRALSSYSALRRGRGRDGAALVALVRAVVPKMQRVLLELRERDYQPGWERAIGNWFKGRRECWWVVEANGVIGGAVRVLRDHGRYPNRLEVLVLPRYEGRFEALLVQRGLASLRGAKKAVETVLPLPTAPLLKSLREGGFREGRVLVQMRLDLPHHVSAVKE